MLVDLTRDEHGCLHARVLDAVEGRSGKVYADWLTEQGVEVTVTVEHAALDPFPGLCQRDPRRAARRGRRAGRLSCRQARRPGTRRGPPPGPAGDSATARPHGRPALHDPPHLLTGVEHLTDRQRERLDKYLPVGDPNSEVEVTWHVYQRVRSIYHADSPAAGRNIAEKVLDTLHTCPIPEVARLGKTLRRWREEILAYFATGGVSNGGTEAINGVIEKTRRLAHGFRDFANYRIRILLAADGSRLYRRPPIRPEPC